MLGENDLRRVIEEQNRLLAEQTKLLEQLSKRLNLIAHIIERRM